MHIPNKMGSQLELPFFWFPNLETNKSEEIVAPTGAHDRTVDQIQSGCGDSYPTSSPEPGAQSQF
jgi:hypothetical protein